MHDYIIFSALVNSFDLTFNQIKFLILFVSNRTIKIWVIVIFQCEKSLVIMNLIIFVLFFS